MVAKEDDRSSIGTERSPGTFFRSFKRFFFFLNLDRKTERTEETEKLNKINRERMEKTKKKKKRRTKEDYDKLTEPNVERKKY